MTRWTRKRTNINCTTYADDWTVLRDGRAYPDLSPQGARRWRLATQTTLGHSGYAASITEALELVRRHGDA